MKTHKLLQGFLFIAWVVMAILFTTIESYIGIFYICSVFIFFGTRAQYKLPMFISDKPSSDIFKYDIVAFTAIMFEIIIDITINL